MTLFHSEGTTFPTSVSCTCAEQVISAASEADSLWQPLDELVYEWASFCTQTMHTTALIATGIALHALSWEQTALRSYTLAHSPLARSRASLLDRTLHDLAEARDRWHRAIIWLDRLANAADDQLEAEALDMLRTLYRQATEQQQRLWRLAGDVQQEQQRLLHHTLATLCVTTTNEAEGGTHV